jgi:hypothetical protein
MAAKKDDLLPRTALLLVSAFREHRRLVLRRLRRLERDGGGAGLANEIELDMVKALRGRAGSVIREVGLSDEEVMAMLCKPGFHDVAARIMTARGFSISADDVKSLLSASRR